MNNLDKYGVLIILAAGAIGVFVPFAAEPFFDMTPAEASDLTSTWILITAAIGLALVFYKHGYASGKAIMRAGLPSNGP